MRRAFGILCLVGLWGASAVAEAQDEEPGSTEAQAEDEVADETLDDAESPPAETPGDAPAAEPAEEEPAPQLRAPSLEGLEFPSTSDEEEEDFGADDEFEEEAERDDAALLGEAEPPATDPTLAVWSNPRPVFTLNGYLRVRGELWDNFFIGRTDRLPFTQFIPADRGGPPDFGGAIPSGGCTGDPEFGDQTRCGTGSDRIRFANMRLRLQPTISLSDDIRVHMMFDAFDNFVLGSTPDVRSVEALEVQPDGTVRGVIPGRAPGVPVDSFTQTSPPPEAGRNQVGDAILVRRAWAEVTNRAIGQLRFGRMGHQWGLGMLWNSGEDIDDDFTTEIDRVQGIAQFRGFFFGASWDFPSQGFIVDPPQDIQAIPFDASAQDDLRQWSFLIARRMDPTEQLRRLRANKWVVNAGVYFIYRRQFLSSSTAPLTATQADFDLLFVNRNARIFIPDVWLQVLWQDLRLEIEFAYIAGTIQNITPGEFPPSADGPAFRFRQYGIAFEFEYRAVQRKLGVYLNTGLASGDPDVVGLSQSEDLFTQPVGKRNISTFSFNPNYRIDLILFRRIMGRVAGVYYLAPGVSYDIIRSSFGQVFGARFDMIYSRAQFEQQTYSSEPNLGVELDFSIYYRSEDGPSFMDGYFIQFQYGILFPLEGLGFLEVDGVREPGTDGLSIGRAQNLRLILAVQF